MRRVPSLALAALLVATVALTGCGGGSGGGGGSAGPAPSGGAKPNPEAEPRAGASSAPVRTEKLERSAGGGKEPGAEGPPAAGVCPRSHAKVVSFQLLSDVPGPRCQVIGPGQRLQLINLTGEPGVKPVPVMLDWAGFHRKIEPHQAVVLDALVGTYLAPGVHEIETEGAPGPTVWLKP